MDIEIKGKKILLIGNGFDLAHGLPTSYSYFLDFCDKVEKIFNKIIFPVIIPGVATQAIFTFVGCWNSYVQPSILLFSQEKFTLPILVQQMQGVYKTDYGVVYLGVTLSVVPILLLFMFCSKKILESSMSGAVKG